MQGDGDVGSQAQLTLKKIGTDGFRYEGVAIDTLVIAGWTGRNQEALEKHIRELEDIGVARPKSTPIFYRIAAALLTNANEVQVSGESTSGEVEFVMFHLADGLWVGLGSDHTDRKAEAIGVALSKQLCPKAIGRQLWRFDEVAPHWDRLVLRAWATIDGARVLYQEGAVAGIRPPQELVGLYAGAAGLAAGTVMFCGTLGAIGGVRPGSRFEMELEDPVLGRRLAHAYDVESLPVVS